MAPGWSSIEELLGQEIGLDPASIGQRTLARAIKRRIKVTGDADEAAYTRRLRAERAEVQQLIEEVVVRNSWFYREPRSFDLLRQCVTERIPAPPGAGPALRVLSLGCAGGEEPYSIAMMLADLQRPPTSYSIDAVDVSRRALDSAAQARYRPASFFGGDLSFREQHFDEEQSEWVLHRRVADRVTWIQGNALEPTLDRRLSIYNVVFCRNLLIYFKPAAQQRAVALIRKVLAPGGFLFVGCVDRSKVAGAGLEPVAFPGAFAFRRLADEEVTRTPVARGTFLIPPLGASEPGHPAAPDTVVEVPDAPTDRDAPALPVALAGIAPGAEAQEAETETETETDLPLAPPDLERERKTPTQTDLPCVRPLEPLFQPAEGPIKPVKSRPDRLLNIETQLLRLDWIDGSRDDEDQPCWKREGIFGEACCLHLDQLDSCYCCPVYCNQGRTLFERPAPPGYRQAWTELLSRPKPPEPTSLTSALVFRLWDQRFALAAEEVVEVAQPGKVQAVPNRTGRVFRGLINVSGCVRLCVSLHEFLELVPPEEDDAPGRPAERVVVMGHEEETWAFRAEEVYGIQRFRGLPSQPPAPSSGLSRLRTSATFTRGTITREAQPVNVLDEELLLAGLKRVLQ